MISPDLDLACATLKRGGIIAYPTEAIWGLGCDPFNEAAVERLLTVKQRSVEKGLLLVGSHIEQFKPLLDDLQEVELARLHSSWPGPTTWIIPDPLAVYPKWIRGTHNSVAIRVSAHPLVSALCTQFGNPIVSTSANLAGQAEIRSRLILEQQFADNIDGIVAGELGDEREPSQIRDLMTGDVVR